MIKYCKQVARSSCNIAVWNTSTDGVSCEVEINKVCTLMYLDGKCNTISLPDINHKVKSLWYHLIDGSSAVPNCLCDKRRYQSWILCIWCIVIRLASVEWIEMLNQVEFEDAGNAVARKLSSLTQCTGSYAVNASIIHWKTRAILQLSLFFCLLHFTHQYAQSCINATWF